MGHFERCQARDADLHGLRNVVGLPKFRSIVWSKFTRFGFKLPSFSPKDGFARAYSFLSFLVPNSGDYDAGLHSKANISTSSLFTGRLNYSCRGHDDGYIVKAP